MASDPYLTAFGRRLTALRSRAGLTQRELAEKAGLTAKYISQVERADTNVSLSVLRKLAIGLGTTPAILLDEEDAVDRHILATVHDRSLNEKRQVLRVVQALFAES